LAGNSREGSSPFPSIWRGIAALLALASTVVHASLSALHFPPQISGPILLRSRYGDTMTLQIQQNKLTDEVKKKVFQGFAQEAIKCTGIDGLNEDPVSFEIFNELGFFAALVVQLFWGQLHIKYLFVEEAYRGQGVARKLMNHALDFAKKRECQVAFVETMSFQAPRFYQKMGFVIEFSRPGYAAQTTFHYLKKIIN
jgi:ribosomal protein S18 acetylase RimI-like enzyme